MKDIISVIVPVYNVASYLPACVESLCSQTYKKLEIILIDDGSTDLSGKLCDKFAQTDGRIRVIHKENGGAASAKNAGLRAATGEYLAFADSDDYLERDAYEFMMDKMKRYQADIVRCGFQNEFVGYREERLSHLQEGAISAEVFLKAFTTDWTCGLLWDKLYRRWLFEGVFFPEGHRIDDEFFTWQGVMRAGTIVTFPRVVYHYRQRKSSVMGSEASKKQIVLDKLEYARERRTQVISAFPGLKTTYDDHYANFLLLLCRDPDASIESLQLAKRQIREFLKETAHPPGNVRLKRLLIGVLCTSDQRLLAGRKKAKIQREEEDLFE